METAATIVSRKIAPFSYFVDHASAIAGFGGDEPSPDPRYCFHTRYEDVRPGKAMYHVRLIASHASVGEMTFKLHAYKPGSDADVELVAGGKVSLAGRSGGDVESTIRFTAIAHVHYALYGYFSEPSDLTVAEIQIDLVEPEEQATIGGRRDSATRSIFAKSGQERANRLMSDDPPDLARPVSQVCTRAQIDSATFAVGFGLPSCTGEAVLSRWAMVAPLQVLANVGLLTEGARGVLITAPDPLLAVVLAGFGCTIDDVVATPDPRAPWQDYDRYDAQFDFLLSYALYDPTWDADARLDHVEATLPCLVGDATALFVLPFATEASHPLSHRPDENEIRQIALRMIGRSYSVAQLAFSSEPVRDAEGLSAFLLMIRNSV